MSLMGHEDLGGLLAGGLFKDKQRVRAGLEGVIICKSS